MKNNCFILAAVAAVVLAVGCFHLPYGYYTFVRIVTFVVAGLLVFLPRFKGLDWRCVVNGLLAILFNPIIPIHLHSRTAWIIIDALAAVWFAVQAMMLYKGKENAD